MDGLQSVRWFVKMQIVGRFFDIQSAKNDYFDNDFQLTQLKKC